MECINQNTFENHKILVEEIETDYFSFHLAVERAVPKLDLRPGSFRCLKRYVKYLFETIHLAIKRDKSDKS